MATSIKPYFLVRRERSFIGVGKNSARRVRFLPAQRKIVERFLSDHPDITKVSQLSGENEEALQRRIGNSPNLHSLARKILAEFSRLRVGCRIGAYAWVFDTDAETIEERWSYQFFGVNFETRVCWGTIEQTIDLEGRVVDARMDRISFEGNVVEEWISTLSGAQVLFP